MLKKLSIVFAILFMIIVPVFSCNNNTGTVGPQSPKDTDQCASACANYRRLSCDQGSDTQCQASDPTCINGKITCEAFCKQTQNNGVWLNPACSFLKTATSGDVTSPKCPEIEKKCAPHN